MTSLFETLPQQWKSEMISSRLVMETFEKIENNLMKDLEVIPGRKNIFRALPNDISAAKVLILGQDPYPNPAYAMGIAFSVPVSTKILPASLRNIFLELNFDLGNGIRENGDLTDWVDQGVVLLNRILTTRSGSSRSHINWGWNVITDRIIEVLSQRNCIGLLWGKTAQHTSQYFSGEYLIQSSHPSPLSARKGFFGSKPFSKVNAILSAQGRELVNWG